MDLTCEERLSDSPFVERVWRDTSGHGGAFISMAESHWGMAVTRFSDKTYLTVRGPETRATHAFSPPEAEFFGIQFKAGTLMPALPARMVMDRHDVTLPVATSQRFWLGGAAWEFPSYDNVEVFVNRLAREGLLLNDPVIGAALEGEAVPASLRTVQRRFLQATGLRQGLVAQIQRARRAVALLKQGVSILDTVEAAGYYDQPHLTRALRHFVGQTPAQISDPNRAVRLSFLYKTQPSGHRIVQVFDERPGGDEDAKQDVVHRSDRRGRFSGDRHAGVRTR